MPNYIIDYYLFNNKYLYNFGQEEHVNVSEQLFVI